MTFTQYGAPRKRQGWTFEGLHIQLDDLDPRIRVRALEIAQRLQMEGISEKRALEEGIKMAEQWFYDLEA